MTIDNIIFNLRNAKADITDFEKDERLKEAKEEAIEEAIEILNAVRVIQQYTKGRYGF